jgi:subtilase family protein
MPPRRGRALPHPPYKPQLTFAGGAAATIVAGPATASLSPMTAPLRCALACAAAALLVAPATAAAGVVEPPMSLPGDASAAALRADRATWIVGARPGRAARALARRHRAKRIGPAGTGGYVLARAAARPFARALRRRGLLVYAQPNTLARPLQAVPNDPLTLPPDDWRARVADPALVPPAVTPESPLIALVDSQLDPVHGEFAGGNTATLPQLPVTNSHGTATASVAAAPQNGVGILGVWPGARALNIPLPDEITCARSTEQINTAIRHRAAVINMSYGSESPCFSEYVAIQFAVARGIVPVAAAGNEFAAGNPLEFPASLPHVLTVAAVGPDLESSFFSNENAAIDLSAFGEGIMTAVPPALDADGVADGYERQHGTSFAAPMVAAAVAWVRAARPQLSADQVAQAVRLSATDIGRTGWERATGFGLLTVGAALTIEPPPRDPSEPNDDMMWVDGRAFERPDRLIYSGRGTRRRTALLDTSEDPADVYRIRLRGRSRVRITANPTRRDEIELAGFRSSARSLRARPLARSSRRGPRTERITLRNRSRRARTFYVAVAIPRRARDLDAGYALRVG